MPPNLTPKCKEMNEANDVGLLVPGRLAKDVAYKKKTWKINK